MSDRGLDAALVTESESDGFFFLYFAKIELDSGDVFVHNGVGDLTFGGDTYKGLGDFAGIAPIQEGTELSPYSISLSLSGIKEADKVSDLDLLTEFIDQDYYLRPVTISIGAINPATGALVADPDGEWSYFIDTASVSIGEDEATLMVSCEAEMILFDRPNGRRYSDADLQAEYSGDLGCQYMDQMVDKTVIWRHRNVTRYEGTTQYGGTSSAGTGPPIGVSGGGI